MSGGGVGEDYWAVLDKLQAAWVSKSLSLVLSIDNEQTNAQMQLKQFHAALAVGFHQITIQLQAL